MKRILLVTCALCLFALLAFAQRMLPGRSAAFKTVAAGGWQWNPTNNSDNIAASIWLVAENYSTNGSIPTWYDASGNGWNATNPATTRAFTEGPLLNGKRTIVSNQGSGSDMDYLRTANFGASGANWFDVVVLCAFTNNAGGIQVMHQEQPSIVFRWESGRFNYGGTAAASAESLTNKWVVYHSSITNAGARTWTNLVATAGTPASVVSNVMTRLDLACNAAFPNSPANATYAEIMVFIGGILATNDGMRSNVFAYLTNKYSLSLPQ